MREVTPDKNGFVNAAFTVYNQHHHLRVRPEDVWFSVLTQLSFYVNAHAEDLRSLFVAHEGKKEVEVYVVEKSIDTVDVGEMAVMMTAGMEKHIVDKDLRAWILPDFTTTLPADTVTASVVMMGTLQKYFRYTMSVLLCGLPSVTLLGEKTGSRSGTDWAASRNGARSRLFSLSV